MKINQCDIIFLSYDEPNADDNYNDLLLKAPHAKRVHGVKGSDLAHKVAAELSKTDWFVTIDADNIVDKEFFDVEIINEPGILAYCWSARNIINGLRYGNGGVKLWHKSFVANMKTHELSEDDRAQVDFCWESGYKSFSSCFSDSIINSSPLQAWRAGFREGVKMTLLDGIKVPPAEIEQQIWWHNIHRLKVWASVGLHETNGSFAVLGARQGLYMTNCTTWDYVQVRDFSLLGLLYNETIKPIEHDHKLVVEKIKKYGRKINNELGISLPYYNALQSQFVVDLYIEALDLNHTYYNV